MNVKCIAVITIVLMSFSVVAGVKINGTGPTYATISEAVDAAVSDDVLTVSTGLYTETVNISGTQISIEGGYAMDCVTKAGSGATVIKAPAGTAVEISGSAVNLSSLEITGGTGVNGAGLSVDGSAVTARQCRIYGNIASGAVTYGGGVNANGSDLVLIDSRISGNKAKYGGGGYASAADIICINCTIDGNEAEDGGAFYAFNAGATLELENVNIISNLATSTAEIANIGGGGIAALFGAEVFTVNCLFDSNYSSNHAGAVAIHGSHLRVGSDFVTYPPLTQPPNRFVNNMAPNDRQGGAILISTESTASIEDALITNNHAGGLGGAIYVYSDSTCDLVNVVIAQNNSMEMGDGVRASSHSILSMTHCTVADNQEYGVAISSTSDLAMTNSIVWGHSMMQVSDDQDVQYSDIQGGYTNGTGNINDNPIFMPGGLYDLTALSPCIDKGIFAGIGFDSIHESRPQGTGVDMGAYEFTSGSPFVGIPVTCPKWKLKNSKKKGTIKGKTISPVLRGYLTNNYGIGIWNMETDTNVDGPHPLATKNEKVWKYKDTEDKIATVKYSEKQNKKKGTYKTKLSYKFRGTIPASNMVYITPLP
jgi:hypothetical protein